MDTNLAILVKLTINTDGVNQIKRGMEGRGRVTPPFKNSVR